MKEFMGSPKISKSNPHREEHKPYRHAPNPHKPPQTLQTLNPRNPRNPINPYSPPQGSPVPSPPRTASLKDPTVEAQKLENPKLNPY